MATETWEGQSIQLSKLLSLIIICGLICLLVYGITGCASGSSTTETTSIESTTMGTTGTTTAESTTTSAQSSNGLQLRFSINATSLAPGETLQVNMSEYNTLATNDNVSAGEN